MQGRVAAMAFVISKIFWALLAPANVILMILIVAALAMGRRSRPVLARVAAIAAAAVILAAGVLPIGYLLLRPLENRFPPPAAAPAHVDGIVILGGAIQPELSASRDTVALNETAERMTAAVALARRYPGARLVFTGGSAAVLPGGRTEADVARRYFAEMGLAEDRVAYEAQARNTRENARFTLDLMQPKPGETWLLVTSARHMPRSVGCFRAVGWDAIVPWPVDYMTRRTIDWTPGFDLAGGLVAINDATHEWIGLVAYRLLGYTAEWFPAPRAAP
jgi:uncharacterized SAM-binding protein YcdF (DUF218 family)